MSLSYWNHNYVQWIYQYLKGQIGNDYGVSGLLGNIYAESGICPFRCEGDYSSPYTTSYDITVNQLRSMSSYDFQHYHFPGTSSSKVGYSLAQWTTYSRKDNYYNFCTQSLLGDGTKSAEFLVHELQTSYSGVWNVLTSALTVRQASNKVLFDYEAPEDQSLPVQNLRAYYGQEVYNEFSGLPPAPATQLPIWMLFKFNDR